MLLLHFSLSFDKFGYKHVDLAVFGQVGQGLLLCHVLICRLGINLCKQVLDFNVIDCTLVVEIFQIVDKNMHRLFLNVTRCHLEDLILFFVASDVFLHSSVLMLVADAGCQDRAQEDTFVIGQLLSRQMDRKQSLRLING